MAATGNGTTNYVRSASSVTAPTVYSYAFWYHPAAAPSTSDVKIPFGMAGTDAAAYSSTFHAAFAWDFNDATVYKGAIHRPGGVGDVKLQLQGTIPFGVWIHIAVTYDGATLKIYLNGALNNSVAAAAESTAHNPFITTNAYDNTIAFDSNPVSQVCVWKSALTADQVSELAHGALPSSIDNGNILLYAALDASGDGSIGPLFNNSGCTFKKTFFIEMTGAPAFGGANIGHAVYEVTMTGGPVFGGNDLDMPIHMNGGFAWGGVGFDSFVQLGNGSFAMVEGRGNAETGKLT